MSVDRPRRVSLFATGGTIATTPNQHGQATPTRGAAAIAEATGPVADVTVEPCDVARVSSRAVTPTTMLRVATAVRQAGDAAAPPHGIVITHGTDTLEETAYFLALTVPARPQVVLTGAMHRPEDPGADGPANVRAALHVAASDDAPGHGPLVVFADEIHAARWVTKIHSTRTAAFASPETGPVGVVSEGTTMLGTPTHRTPPLGLPTRLPHRVEVVWAYAGADHLLVDRIAPLVDALVVAGTGGGHVPPPMAEALARLARHGMPIVLTTRCASGPTLTATYAGTGSETHLLASGVLPGGRISPIKARLRLLVALALDIDPATVFPVT